MNLFTKSTWLVMLIFVIFTLSFLLSTSFVIFVSLLLVTFIPIVQTVMVLMDNEQVKEDVKS